jgi:hypothetical protein
VIRLSHMSDTTTTEQNVVTLAKGNKRASIRITKHADGRVSSEVGMTIAWRSLGGLDAAFNEQARLEAQDYKVVAAV